MTSKHLARAPRVGPFPLRRARIHKAAEALKRAAVHSAFRPTYARMNPRGAISRNVFHFGEINKAPRAVIIGPWLYINAPGRRFPTGVVPYTREESRRRHYGRFSARLLLTSKTALASVQNLILVLAERPT